MVCTSCKGRGCDACQPRPLRLPPGFWDQPTMRAALASWKFGKIVREARYAAGLTQDQMAERLAMAATHVSRIECGRRKVTTLDVARRIANVLGIPPNLLGFRIPATVDQGPTVPGEDDPMRRRAFVQTTSALAMGLGAAGLDVERLLALVPLTDLPRPARIGMSDVEVIEQATEAYRRLDYSYGGGHAQAAAVKHVYTALPLLDAESTAQVRSRLLIAIANQARVAARMSEDIQDHQAARSLWRIGLTLARETDDPRGPDLIVAILLQASAQALTLQSPDAARTLLRTARAVAEEGITASTRSSLAHNTARVHAATGDISECERSLGQVQDTFAVADPDNTDPATATPWAAAIHPAALPGWLGWDRYELAKTTREPKIAARAIPALQHAITQFLPSHVRTRAINLTKLAGSHVLTGDMEAAVATGHQAIEAGQHLSSHFVRRGLHDVHTLLAPAQGNQAVDDLRERLTAAAAIPA